MRPRFKWSDNALKLFEFARFYCYSDRSNSGVNYLWYGRKEIMFSFVLKNI